MKKSLLTILAAFILLAALTISASAEPILGGWAATTDSSITEDAQAAFDKAFFDKAFDDFAGVDYEPVDLLATQVVAGTNYCFLCRGKVVASNEAPGYYLVYVYADLEGNAEILDIQQLAFGVKEQTAQKDEYVLGETWVVEGQWELTIDAVEETADRNEYADTNPAAVYIVTFTYKNTGYQSDFADGLFFVMDDRIVDAEGQMGYSYPGDVTMYPNEAPVGAICTGQVCIGVEHPGPFKIYVDTYDGNEQKQSAVFGVEIE